MNIYRFKIEVTSKKKTTSMEKATVNCFRNDSTEKSKYKEFVLNLWSHEDDYIKSLFTESQVLAVVNEDLTRYYVAKVRANDDPIKIQYDILVISNTERINDSIKKVYASLKKKLSDYKISISDNVAHLYITEKNRILSTQLAIKANIVVRGLDFSIREWIRLGLIILLIILSIVFCNVVDTENAKNIWLSLLGSSIFWIISELVVKIRVTKELEVNDLTNCMSSIPPKDELNDSVSFNTPVVQDWGA